MMKRLGEGMGVDSEAASEHGDGLLMQQPMSRETGRMDTVSSRGAGASLRLHAARCARPLSTLQGMMMYLLVFRFA